MCRLLFITDTLARPRDRGEVWTHMATSNGLGAGQNDSRAGPDSPNDQPSAGQPVRLSLNVSAETMSVLRDYAGRKGISLTEAVRRAIGILNFVDEAQESGASLVIERNGKTQEIIFLA